MTYEEYLTSIQEAVAANLNTGNIIFGIFLLIAIIVGLTFFFLYTRKEYYRKRSEIDAFMLEENQKTKIFVPGIDDKVKPADQKVSFFEKLYRKLNKDG